MARVPIETGGLDWGDFRALEYFAIIYDIAIDEERYNPEWCQLKLPSWPRRYVKKLPNKPIYGNKPWATDRYFLFPHPTNPGDLPDVTISANFDLSKVPLLQGPMPPEKLRNGELTFPALRDESANQIASLWRRLLLAKRVRAKLQKDGSTTALDALDKLGLALLRAMPLPEREVESHKLNELQIQYFILKILFLNEAAACYRGYQSISLADDCLNLIKDVFKEGKTPYELVALYNKAQGYLHIRDYDDALREFENVDKETSDKQKNKYFHSETSDSTHLRWPNQKELFDAYVGYPSVLQCAETLLNLQRSWEAERRLPEPTAVRLGPVTAYQGARRSILIEKLKNDRSPGETAPKWPKHGVEPVNLAFQRLAVDGEWALAKCKLKIADALQALRDDEPSDATKAIHGALVAFGRAIQKLRTRMQRANKNRSEIDEACLSWADGLSACKELLSFALPEEGALDKKDVVGNNRYRVLKRVNDYFYLGIGGFVFRDVAVGLCIDPGYRDHAVEVRKTLIKNLSSIHDLRDPDGKRKPVPPRFEKLFADIAKCLRDLLDRLDKNRPRFAPEVEIRGWRERRILLDDGLLPDEGPASSVRHEELRAFVGYGFVHPIEDDGALDAKQREIERKDWRECPAKYGCIEKRGKPSDCGGRVLAKNPSFMSAESGSKTLHQLDRLVQMNRDTIRERLYTQQKHDSGWHFVVLQRWNSFTPAMRASEGGGYFLCHAVNSNECRGLIDVGVVIDPGYGFVKNFVSEGFGVRDITAIVITHDHPDHLADVGSLVNLLVEVRKNRGGAHGKTSKVDMLLSRGAFERLNPLIESAREVFRDTVVLDPERTEYDIADKKVLFLKACRALHRDASDLPHREGFDSVGLIAQIGKSPKSKARIGISSDTKWDAKISGKFAGHPRCDLICLHLGSITPEKFRLISYFDENETSLKVLHKKYHLYLPGVVWHLEDLLREHPANGMPAMVILSEFGEELAGGGRIDIARRLQAYTEEKGKGKVVVLPGDVGLRVDPTSHTIRCSCCHLEHPRTTPFRCETSGSSEQISYICPWCLRNFTQEERAENAASRHPSLPGNKS